MKRAKSDIKNIASALDRVSKLRGVSYRFKGEEGPGSGRLGLIAQEVRTVVPEAGSTDEERGSGISYSTLVPLLIEAVKELKDQVDALRSEIAGLSKATRPPSARKAKAEK